MLNLLSALKPNQAMFWLLVALGILVLIEIALFAILIIRGRGKEEPEPRKLVGLTLDTSLVKREYELGEQFDVAGLIATVNYSDEPFEEIIDEFTIATPELLEELERDGKKPEEFDGCLVYIPDLTILGKPTVTVSYHGANASYAVSVVKEHTDNTVYVAATIPAPAPAPEPVRTLIGISLVTDYVRKEYTEGDNLDLTGLVVCANYNTEPRVQVITEGYEIQPVDMSQVGMPMVMVSYCGFTIGFHIAINPAPVISEPEIKEPEPIVKPEPIIVEEESFEAGILRYDRSFTAKLIQSDDELKRWYTTLKNHILSFKKVKDRLSWKRESYRYGREVVAKLAFRGKTLCIFLPLNPADYAESKYKIEDASESSTYEETPCMYRIKNERRLKYAMELIDVVMERLSGGVRIERESVDYYVPYEGIVELIGKGLIKRNIKSRQDEAFFEEKQAQAEAAAAKNEDK